MGPRLAARDTPQRCPRRWGWGRTCAFEREAPRSATKGQPASALACQLLSLSGAHPLAGVLGPLVGLAVVPLLVVVGSASAPAAVPLSVEYPVSRVPAKVLSVVDGDSLTVAAQGKQLKLRLACIDAPERSQAPWGQASQVALKALLPAGSPILLTPLGTDRYGRTVTKVLSEKGNISWLLVRRGQALVYRQNLSPCDRAAFFAAERKAQRQRLGLWGQPPLPVAAWERRWCRRQGGGC